MVTPSMPPPTRFTPDHAPSALPMRSSDGTGAIPTILIGTLVCPTIGAGDPVPAAARAANIIMEQAPVAESLRLPWALKHPPREATGLTAAVFRDRATGATHTCPLRHLFLF